MKILHYPLKTLALSLAIAACSPQPKVETPEPDDTLSSKPIVALDTTERKEERLQSIKFPINCANEEITFYLEDPDLKTWAKNLALGGTFYLKDEFFAPSSYDKLTAGVMMWYAVTQDEHGKTTIAMAIQPGEKPEGGLSPAEPTDVGLIYPDDVFTFDQSSINLRIEHKLKKKKLKEKKPTRNNTNLRRQAFSDQNHSSTYSRNFNKHNGAFFQNNPETKKPDDTEGLLKRLLTQDGAVGVRYYFALKKDTKYDNMIRIILVAVDAKGNDLIQINDPATNKLVEGLVVQKSIPPGSQKLDYCER